MAAHTDPSTAINDLHRLLLVAVPEDDKGQKTIVNLAKLLDMSRSGVWKWIKAKRIPPDRATRIVDLSEGRVTLADFSRFVYDLDS